MLENGRDMPRQDGSTIRPSLILVDVMSGRGEISRHSRPDQSQLTAGPRIETASRYKLSRIGPPNSKRNSEKAAV